MNFLEKLSGMFAAESEDEIRRIIKTMNTREKNSFIIGYFDYFSGDQKEEFIFNRITDMRNNNVIPDGWEKYETGLKQ